MQPKKIYDVIIIGGSYAGLSAAMSLGRALQQVLVIDAGKPCNRTTPFSHNFITQDGTRAADIASQARSQVATYPGVTFFEGVAVMGQALPQGFAISTDTGDLFTAAKLIFATGVNDYFPAIAGYRDCWGISVLHCPYCHGYEVADKKTGILGNGEHGYDLAVLISNWTNELTLFTNGVSTLSPQQTARLQEHHIIIQENEIDELIHEDGYLQKIVYKDGTADAISVLYARFPLTQQSAIPQMMGCAIDAEGYIVVDGMQETSIKNIYACGDNSNKIRTLANAAGSGTTAGMTASKSLIAERF